MLLRVLAATRAIQPHIEPQVHQLKRNRILAIDDPAHCWIQDPMLTDHHPSWCIFLLFFMLSHIHKFIFIGLLNLNGLSFSAISKCVLADGSGRPGSLPVFWTRLILGFCTIRQNSRSWCFLYFWIGSLTLIFLTFSLLKHLIHLILIALEICHDVTIIVFGHWFNAILFARNSKYSINIAILGGIFILMNEIAVISDHLEYSLSLIIHETMLVSCYILFKFLNCSFYSIHTY